MTDAGDELVERLANRIGGSMRASAAFGKPVERGGVTVIPVARARFAFGGGSGTDPQSGGHGGGGGGAGTVQPLGYIEVRKGGVTFRPIRDWRAIGIAAAGAAVAAGAVAAFALRRR
jgi:uncharacterized spore protein YtfJ